MSDIFPVPGAWNDSWDLPLPLPTTRGDVVSTTQCQTSSTSTPPTLGTHDPNVQGDRGGTFRPSVREMMKPPIVIAVFGQTGTGKTTFIKAVTGKDLAVGHNLTSCVSLHVFLEWNDGNTFGR
jgi:hypothetical protein